MNRTLGAALALIAIPVFLAGAANAQTSTAPVDLDVSITIIDSCEVTTNAGVAFGNQAALTTALTTQGSLDVICSVGTPYSISLSDGEGVGASAAVRKMTGPADATIDYSLYTDNTYETVWDEESTVDGSGTGATQAHTVYGRIPVQSTPAPGVYTDTVSVVVHY